MASPSRARGTRLPPSPLGHPLPPIRTFLAAELSLPLPAAPRHDPVPMDVDPVLPRVLQPRSSPYPGPSPRRTPPHTAPLPTPSPSSSSLLRSSTPRLRRSPPHRDPAVSHHSSSAPPAFSYVLRPSPSGGLVTSVHTTRPRSRSLYQPTPPSGAGAGPGTGSSGGTSTSTSSSSNGGATTAIRRARAESDGARRHVCPVCQKRFNRPSTLRTHENVHTGLRPFACPHPTCAKVFSVASNMRRHYLRAHADAAADEDDLDDDDHLEWVPMYEAH